MQDYYNNVFYKEVLYEIGGIETFFWSIAEKYGDRDILFVYKNADEKQLQRLESVARVMKYKEGMRIRCKKAFFCWNANIIDAVDAEEYIMMIHGDYKALGLQASVPRYEKITGYIGVSKICCETFTEITGIPCNLIYNPFIQQKPKRILRLISATRLTAEKGKERMEKLAKAMDNAGIPFQWLVFTDSGERINNPSVIFAKPRLDLTNYIADADYLVQLSSTEGLPYSVTEALAAGTPVIVTDYASVEETGVADGVNGWILPMDMSEIPLQKIVKKLPRFRFKPNEDRWGELLVPGEGTYREELKSTKTIRAVRNYYDLKLEKDIAPGTVYRVQKNRAEEIIARGYAELMPD